MTDCKKENLRKIIKDLTYSAQGVRNSVVECLNKRDGHKYSYVEQELRDELFKCISLINQVHELRHQLYKSHSPFMHIGDGVMVNVNEIALIKETSNIEYDNIIVLKSGQTVEFTSNDQGVDEFMSNIEEQFFEEKING